MAQTVCRPLGLLEKYQISKHLAKVYGNISMSIRFRFSSKTSPLHLGDLGQASAYFERRLIPAFKQLCSEIPQLMLGVIDTHTTVPKFLHIGQFDFAKILTISVAKFFDDAILSQSIAEEIRHPFDLGDHTLPLWRLLVLVHEQKPDEFVVMWVVHHVIADGLSMTILWTRLLEKLNGAKETIDDGQNSIIIAASTVTLEPPCDQRTRHHPTLFDLIPVIVKKKVLPSFIAEYFDPPYWAGKTPAIREPHHTLARVFEIPRQATLTLGQKCKSENTTLHAALYVSTVINLLEVFCSGDGAEDTGQGIYFRSFTPFNARTLCDPVVSSTESGNFVGSFERNFGFQRPLHGAVNTLKSDFWTYCRIYKTELSASLVQGVKVTNMLQYIGEFPSQWLNFWSSNLKNHPMGRNASFEISDLGKWNVPSAPENNGSEAGWELVSATFTQSANVVGPSFLLNCVTAAGVLRGMVTWHKGALEEDDVQRFVNGIRRTLLELLA
ncbi:alcohol acetyltransferase [Endogone sp. FLAS-F59071]|nr:alcohol acetyltransferase [Endogone sp. FLAS-F59071]|eukprot:RUS13851.1 alcohol acetyltransferase [Endogone sp. FLAS-F59071]